MLLDNIMVLVVVAESVAVVEIVVAAESAVAVEIVWRLLRFLLQIAVT